MNSLCQYIELAEIDPVKAMNALQDNGVVSDNCIDPQDVGDSGKAVQWLNMNFPHRIPEKRKKTLARLFA